MVGSLKIRVKPKLQISGVNKPGTNRPSPVVTMRVIMVTHANKTPTVTSLETISSALACMDNMTEDRLKTKDAAELLGISKRTLLRYANKRLISPYRLSKRNFRWLRSDLEELLNKSKGGDAV
jgi:excisionase family DNA binding protein